MASPEQIRNYLSQPYSRVLVRDPSGRYFAEILELPGCFSEGDSPDAAIRNLDEAMAGWIDSALDSGQQIPPPLEIAGYSGRVLLRLPKSLHREAVRRAEIEGVSLNQYLVVAIATHIKGDDLADRIASSLSRTLTFTLVTQVQIADTAGAKVLAPPLSPVSQLQEADSTPYQPSTIFQRRERQHA